MADPAMKDGLTAAAAREKDFHPSNPNGSPITAWERRAATLNLHADRIEAVEARVDAIPFPFRAS